MAWGIAAQARPFGLQRSQRRSGSPARGSRFRSSPRRSCPRPAGRSRPAARSTRAAGASARSGRRGSRTPTVVPVESVAETVSPSVLPTSLVAERERRRGRAVDREAARAGGVAPVPLEAVGDRPEASPAAREAGEVLPGGGRADHARRAVATGPAAPERAPPAERDTASSENGGAAKRRGGCCSRAPCHLRRIRPEPGSAPRDSARTAARVVRACRRRERPATREAPSSTGACS